MGLRVQSGAAGMSQMGGASRWQQRRQDFNQLTSALQSGDLSSAQKAYASISAKSPAAANPNSPLAALGKALQAGDIGAAQQALSAMHSGGHHSQQAPMTQASAGNSPALASSGLVGTLLNSFA